MPEQLFTHRLWRIAAIKWTGHNFPEIQQFVRDHVGPDDETGVRNEPDEGCPTEKFAYNMVQFDAMGAQRRWHVELDPDRWIVVHLDIPADQDMDNRRVEVLDDDDLRIAYEQVPAPAAVESTAPPFADPDDPAWTHGTRLGREHRSLDQHLIEDHGVTAEQIAEFAEHQTLVAHDMRHGQAWAHGEDLPHPAPNDPQRNDA